MGVKQRIQVEPVRLSVNSAGGFPISIGVPRGAGRMQVQSDAELVCIPGGAHPLHRAAVAEQEVVCGGEGPGAVFVTKAVTHPGRDPRLVQGDPEPYAIRESFVDDSGVLCKALARIPVSPAAQILQRLRQVPMIERKHRFYGALSQAVDKSAVKLEAVLVGRTAPLGLDAGPGHGEAVLPYHLRAGIPDSLRQGVAVGFDQFVDYICDLVQGEDARSVAVEHSGVMDVVPPTLQRRPDREVLDDRVWDAGPSTLRREVSYMAGPQARAVDQNRHFHAASFRKVRNETRILHVAVYGPRLTGDERVNDERAVLHTASQREVLSGEQFAASLGVLDEVLLATPDVLVNRDIVEFDEAVVFEEVVYVLGVVLARLGDEVPEAAHQLEAHLVFGVHVRVFQRREQQRVGVLAFDFEACHPGDVVDAGALVEKLLMLDPDV